METINWDITSGCTSLGGGCVTCPSRWEYKEKGWNYAIQMHHERITEPLSVERPSCFIVSLGSDLFHEGVTDIFIKAVFKVMNEAQDHQFEVATKRTERLAKMADELEWTPNIMIGTGIESEENLWRMDDLKKVPTENRFISFAPLLGDVGILDLSGIKCAGAHKEEWGIKRPFDQKWYDNIKTQCKDQGVHWIDSHVIYEEVA